MNKILSGSQRMSYGTGSRVSSRGWVRSTRGRVPGALLMVTLVLTTASGVAQEAEHRKDEALAAKPTLYTTATAHLDTQWLWTIQTTIDEYLPNTLRENFDRFEKFPDYVFSFEGAFRYMLAKEYYPEDYARLKDYVAKGRWCVCGSFVDACDVNIPSPESLVRHILYGNGFFEREFGKRSADVFLPDCFGFGYALPSVAAHCGLVGFSTQKLTWGSSVGIPFEIGLWEGVDGSTVIAAVKPGDYVAKLRGDLSVDEEWLSRLRQHGDKTGAYVGYKYFGVGDQGGAPDEESVTWLERAVNNDGPIRVINAAPDRLFRDVRARLDLAASEKSARRWQLPRYKGEMLMTRHGTGCYTSQAAMKRWNRKNELLADASERASVVADWLGTAPYPTAKFEEAWIRFLWHQFHDDVTGTSIPEAYTFSWNDQIIALNQFAAELANAVGAVASAMDTRAEGISIVVFNPLAFDREDVVEATVRFAGGAPRAVKVYDATGHEVPSQIRSIGDDLVRMLFLGRVPSVGFAVFDVRSATGPYAGSNELTVSEATLENSQYRVTLDSDGNVSSFLHKPSARELLASSSELQLLRDTPAYWSEWEVRYEDVTGDPYATVGGPAKISIRERGPVRATIEVSRELAGSTFIQRIRLASGEAGDQIEFDTMIDWRTPTTLLKAAFPLAAANATATYDLGLGVIERPNNTESLYEVPAQQWADITHRDGSFGVAILNDCKYGWDKPADNILRLTLIHSPNEIEKDLGWHRVTYAMAPHVGDWRRGDVVQRAARLNQPLLAFQTTPHPGELGRSFSFLKVNSPGAFVGAVKKAESSDDVVVRLRETHGERADGVKVELLPTVLSAREVTGAEKPVGSIAVDDHHLGVRLGPCQPRTLALRLERPEVVGDLPVFRSVELPFDTDVVSFDADKSDGDFDGKGHTLPGELLPERVVSSGTRFSVGPMEDGRANAVSCRGQTVTLPTGGFDRLYVLAAADETTVGTFHLGDGSYTQTVRAFDGWIGQSQSLIVDGRMVGATAMAPAFIHRDEVAWIGTHRHDGTTDQNESYVFCYLFKYGFDLPPHATVVTLPDNEEIKILSMTLARNTFDDTLPAQPLYDQLTAVRIEPLGGLFVEPITVRLSADRGEPAVKLLYTLDGSTPTSSVTLYADPITITKDTTLTARAMKAGVLEDHFVRATFRIAAPRDSVVVQEASPGLAYRYYEGKWTTLPDFDGLVPVKSGSTATFGVRQRNQDDEYGFVFRGYLRVPTDGVYTFYTASDDGSKLYIHDDEVVNNDGLHGKRERFGAVALKAGLHPIKVTYFERGGDDELDVFYEGPGINRQVIPANVLSHR